MILVLFCLRISSSYGQNSIILKGGIGIPEMASISTGTQVNQLQFMVGLGLMPIPDDNLFSIFGDMYFHLWGQSEHSNIKPWYGRSGLSYFREKTPRWIDRYSYLDIRLGREMFLSEKLSIEADLGIAIELSSKREYLTPTSSWLNIEFPVLPAIGMRIVYRFNKNSKE